MLFFFLEIILILYEQESSTSDWIDCEAWNEIALMVEHHIKKGMQVYVLPSLYCNTAYAAKLCVHLVHSADSTLFFGRWKNRFMWSVVF